MNLIGELTPTLAPLQNTKQDDKFLKSKDNSKQRFKIIETKKILQFVYHAIPCLKRGIFGNLKMSTMDELGSWEVIISIL